MYKIKWTTDYPEGIDEIVMKDIANNLEHMKDPSRLIFHSVQLTENKYGPSVTVYGEEDDKEYFYCAYLETTEWKSFKA